MGVTTVFRGIGHDFTSETRAQVAMFGILSLQSNNPPTRHSGFILRSRLIPARLPVHVSTELTNLYQLGTRPLRVLPAAIIELKTIDKLGRHQLVSPISEDRMVTGGAGGALQNLPHWQ
jgi:hypothetical protein